MRSRLLLLLATSFAAACVDPADSTGPGFGGKGDNPWDSDEVVAENAFATYATSAPFVKSVKWSHPKIKRAMAALGPGWRSTFSYGDWKKAYGLENEGTGTDTQQRDARVRNFMRVLAGEFRDHPELLEAKLDAIIEGQTYAGPNELTSVDTNKTRRSRIRRTAAS